MATHFWSLINLETYNLQLLLWGMITLLAATIPILVKSRHITAPVIYIIIGGLLYLAVGKFTAIDDISKSGTIKKICEFVVLVSLVNAGLKIRDPFTWQTWKHSFWLLLVTMPLTIVAAAFAGSWIFGLAPATAILFGALISPTDPVLASDLQTSRPSKKDISKTRLALTSEAGINDGLAFPFIYFAILMNIEGLDFSSWLSEWLLVDVLYKISVGVALGLGLGWLFYQLIFRLTAKAHHSKISRGILSISLTLVPYAITEIVGGYGFLAVFLAACVFSNSEKIVHHMDSLHDFTEEIERMFVALLFVIMGVYLFSHWIELLDWRLIFVALAVLLVIRPLFGWLAVAKSDLSAFEKFVVSFYGIRGIGSVFYLLYALNKYKFEGADVLVRVTAVTIILSVLIHGISAAAIQKRLNEFDTNTKS